MNQLKVLSITILIGSLPLLTNAQDKSYVRTSTIQTSGFTNESANFMILSNNQVSTTTNYVDGLGRPIQGVTKQGSPGSNDIVEHIEYDEFGRQIKTHLPFSSGVDGLFKTGAAATQNSFYDTHFDGSSGNYAFSENGIEASPLGRVLESYAPGEAWAKTSGDKPVTFSYRFNESSDQVKLWTIGTGESDKPTTAGEYDNTASTNGSALTVVETTEEEGNTVIEFKDKQGRVVLKKVQKTGSVYLSTYYVYDDFGNLRYVMPPEAVNAIGSSTTITDLIRDDFCFYYYYDVRKRMIIKKVPGAGAVHLAYDNRDRLVMTQDANQRTDGKWSYTKYDQLSRPVITGVFTDNTSGHDRAWHQAQLDMLPNDKLSVAGDDELPDSYMQGTIIEVSAHDGQSTEYHAEQMIKLLPGFQYQASGTDMLIAKIVNPLPTEIEGAWVDGYYDKTYPDIAGSEILSQTYYDDYDFTTDGVADYQYNSSYNAQFGTAPIAFTTVKGQVTGTKTKIIGTNQYITSVTFYDDRYRPIQVQTTNVKGALDVSTSEYDFVGRVLTTYQVHDNPSSDTGETTVKMNYTYDHGSRLLSVDHSIDGGTAQITVQNTYNELGELESKDLHDEGGSTYAQSIDYAYNIRGWLTKMNDPVVTDPAKYFSMQLKYDNATSGHEAYNGNIGTIDWKNPIESTINTYDYDYDPLNRLTAADYGASTDYDVTGITYDDNGNILTLTRKGLKTNGTMGDIDDLDYDYSGNQLIKVDDINENVGFRSAVSQTTEYTYDGNGNMITDANKGITDIDYNHLNLPQKVDMGSGNFIEYTYDAAGIKHQQKVYENNVLTKTTDYMGGFIYENNALQFAQHDEGRLIPPTITGSGWEYQYGLKDHLGNTRVTFTTEDRVTNYLATLEDANNTAENEYFFNIDNRVTYPLGGKAVQLNNAAPIGVAISFGVVPGDKIDLSTKAYYTNTSGFGTGATNSGTFANAVSSAFGGLDGGVEGNQQFIYDLFTALGTALLSPAGNVDNQPSAYLNYLVFDQNYVLNTGKSGYVGIGANASTEQTLSASNIEIDEAGFVYIYVSNESNSANYVYFDNLDVTINESRILEKSDYYPFGLTFNEYSKGGMIDQKYKFNGKEKIGDLDVDWYDYGARMYDASLARWNGVDKSSENYVNQSPYHFAGNNPIIFVDHDGNDYGVSVDQKAKTITIKAQFLTSSASAATFKQRGSDPWNTQSGKNVFVSGGLKNLRKGNADVYKVNIEVTSQESGGADGQGRGRSDRDKKVDQDKTGTLNSFDVETGIFPANQGGGTRGGNQVDMKKGNEKGGITTHEVNHAMGVSHTSEGGNQTNSGSGYVKAKTIGESLTGVGIGTNTKRETTKGVGVGTLLGNSSSKGLENGKVITAKRYNRIMKRIEKRNNH